MAWYNQDKRFGGSGDCQSEYAKKDFAGRWLTNVTLHTLGYSRVQLDQELYCKGDDFYTLGERTLLVESRTNVRVWDRCLLPNAEINQWIRGGKGESDLIMTWGGAGPHSWIGHICLGDQVRSSPTKMRGARNVHSNEQVYVVPWQAIKMIVMVTDLRDGTIRLTMWDYRKYMIGDWSLDTIPNSVITVDVPCVPAKVYNIEWIPDCSTPFGAMLSKLKHMPK